MRTGEGKVRDKFGVRPMRAGSSVADTGFKKKYKSNYFCSFWILCGISLFVPFLSRWYTFSSLIARIISSERSASERFSCRSADRAEPPLDLFVMSSPSRRYAAFCMRFTCCRVIAFESLQQPLLRACALSSCAPSIARGRGERGREWGYKNESSHVPHVWLLAQRQVA